PRVLILRMRHVSAVDSTGIRVLREVLVRSRADGTLLVLSGVHAQPMVALARAGLLDDIGDENICGNIDLALDRARAYLGLAPSPPPAPAAAVADPPPARAG
ncbi:MAG TPA: sodium-independent anion transporter, partial [Longimicrobiales bacterium]